MILHILSGGNTRGVDEIGQAGGNILHRHQQQQL